MEFEKEYESSHQKKADQRETWKHSSVKAQLKEQEEVSKHNLELLNEYYAGEEGIDERQDRKNDPRYANINKIKDDFRAEINRLKMTEPNVARMYEQ